MVKVLNQVVKNERYPKNVVCEMCGAELEYDQEDEYVGLFGYDCVKCPCCGKDVTVNKYQVTRPIFPTSFYHFGGEESKKLTDEETQKYIDKVLEDMQELEVGKYTYTGSGDTMVYGFRYEDEDVIQVCKNYYEDNIFKE